MPAFPVHFPQQPFVHEAGIRRKALRNLESHTGVQWPGERGLLYRGRTPLVIASSGDDGKTFTEPVAFEWDKESGYCYCAICFTGESLLLAYCAGGKKERSCLVKTRIRRVDRADVEKI